MATKTWIATDVLLGKLTITPEDGSLHIERRYKFVDASGNIMTQIEGGRVVVDVDVADIPLNIATALQAIDTWTHTQALKQESMFG